MNGRMYRELGKGLKDMSKFNDRPVPKMKLAFKIGEKLYCTVVVLFLQKLYSNSRSYDSRKRNILTIFILARMN